MKENALYLEADEDITSAIDKLNKVSGDTVQIVVPKRSTLLQSVINQKLLKKAAESSGKKLVIVTNDRVASELASRLGLAVAASLGAEAVVASIKLPQDLSQDDDTIQESDPEPEAKQSKPEKSSDKKSRKVSSNSKDNKQESPNPEDAEVPHKSLLEPPEHPPKVPSLSRLNKFLIYSGCAIALVIAYFVGMYYFSSATITIYANGARSNINTSFIVDTSVSTSDTNSKTLAGQSLSTSHSVTTTFTPTGKQNNGTKASGSITVTNNSGVAQPLVAGTRFIAPDGNVFSSNSAVTVPAATPTISPGGQIGKQPGTVGVGVTATASGDTYNEASGQAYSIPGLSSSPVASLISAQGGQMSGGTTVNVTVVTQADITKATNAALESDKAAGLRTLKGQVIKDDIAFESSLVSTPTNVVSNPSVGGAGNSASLSLTINYTMTAVNKNDYTAVVENIEQVQLGSGNQVYDNGIATATVTAGAVTGTQQSFNFKTVASGGPAFNTSQIASQIAGNKYNVANAYIEGLSNVASTNIKLSPVWSTKLPKITKHIKINVKISQN